MTHVLRKRTKDSVSSIPAATALSYRVRSAKRLLASATMALELLVQIPFLGPSILQLIFGVIAIFMAVLAIRARREDGGPGAFPPCDETTPHV